MQTKEEKATKRKQYDLNNKEKKAAADKRYRERHKESIAAKDHQYYINHKDKIKKYNKQYRIDNREELTTQKEQYYQKNKEEIDAWQKQYREDNKEQLLEYKKEWYHNTIEDRRFHYKKYYENNKERLVNYSNLYRMNYKERVRGSKLKCTHGITLEEYGQMFLLQNGRCLICGVGINSLSKPLCVDHDHITGEIRGLLCGNCNVGLGLFKESISSLKNAINYLNKFFSETDSVFQDPLPDSLAEPESLGH